MLLATCSHTIPLSMAGRLWSSARIVFGISAGGVTEDAKCWILTKQPTPKPDVLDGVEVAKHVQAHDESATMPYVEHFNLAL